MKAAPFAAGTPSWVDLMTVDQDAAIAFYCDLFGWQCMKSGPEMGNYGMCFQGDAPVAGIGPMPDGSPFPAAWTMYISTDDAAASAAAAVEAGGQIMAEVMDVGGAGDELMGRMAIIMDPSGGVFGVWEPHGHKGSGIVNEPVSFVWNELLSRDAKASRDFLEAVFGYDWAPMEGTPDGMEYYTGKINGGDVIGAMDIPEQFPAEVPSHWQTYFGVADTDDTLARAVAS
ncbi:MAG: VOC family protein, partial [Actinobacteria bacterium]|nr:VOC family protein [Actinomycetota bacterium]